MAVMERQGGTSGGNTRGERFAIFHERPIRNRLDAVMRPPAVTISMSSPRTPVCLAKTMERSPWMAGELIYC